MEPEEIASFRLLLTLPFWEAANGKRHRRCKYNCGNCGYVLGTFTVQGTVHRAQDGGYTGTQGPLCQKKGPLYPTF